MRRALTLLALATVACNEIDVDCGPTAVDAAGDSWVAMDVMDMGGPDTTTFADAVMDAASDSGTPTAPDRPLDPGRAVVESDIYRLVDGWLYVHNEATGLNIVDARSPGDLALVDQLVELSGPAGELYVHDGKAFVLLESTPGSCPFAPDMEEIGPVASVVTEIAAVVSIPEDAKVMGRYCMPGELVSSRVVGDILYAVTTWADSAGTDTTWLLSVDLTDPLAMRLVDYRVDVGDSREIHVTPWAIFVAQQVGSQTEILYIDITDPTGIMEERDSILVSGTPRGRWHMDARGSTFRIVTYDESLLATQLHVIDVSDPGFLLHVGAVTDLAPGEELWATRFVGDKVYIVTYLTVPDPDPPPGWCGGSYHGCDPLWIISLENPASPEILGELEIPGWSNFIFPRGDRLLTAGRGADGDFVSLSLFDVSDPEAPSQLRSLDIGTPASTSEVNEDHRGVTIIEDESFGAPPLLVIPYTNNVWSGGSCTPVHHLQLVDLLENDLVERGDLDDPALGRVLRTTPLGQRLLSISDRSVSVVHVFDRDLPGVTDSLVVGDPDAPDPCLGSEPPGDDPWPGWDDSGGWGDGGTPDAGSGWNAGGWTGPLAPCESGCSIAARPPGAPAPLLLALAALLAVAILRRRPRGRLQEDEDRR